MTAPEVPILSAVDVSKHYHRRGSDPVRALDGVSVEVRKGRSVGLAGESGSGKSSLLRLLLALDRPSDGHLEFRGDRLDSLTGAGMRQFRSEVQTVFQDTTNCFNPRMRILESVTEPAAHLRGVKGAARRELASRLMESVGLDAELLTRYPHQLSGGQRQRVAIARALSSDPSVVLLDEPVTALDVSVRGSVLNLFRDRAAAEELTYVVISHDLMSIYYLTDYLYVMRRGKVVEEGSTVDVIHAPQHPYTQMLVRSIADPLYDPTTSS